MILIKNTQRTIVIHSTDLKNKIQKILDVLGYSDFDIGIWITTNQTIKKYNKTYRNKDKATDVLSFPYHPRLKPSESITVNSPEDKNLGDIIISAQHVLSDAKKLNVSFDQRLIRIVVHGISHLLGYDHQTEKEYQAMYAFEKKLLKHIS